jgi:single-strand DNA-binding protein
MPNLNKVMLMGNLTRDPEIKYTPKGTAVADLALAINRVYSTDQGEKREETTFVDVELWGRQAEIAGEYCKKGRSVYIEGRLQLDSWEDKTSGQKRSKLRVVGEAFQLLGPRPGGSSGPTGDEAGSQERPQRRESSGGFSAGRSQAPSPSVEEDDIPF